MSYVPRSIAAFCAWAIHLVMYVARNYERWGIPPPPESMDADVRRLKELADKCAVPGHTDLDVSAKNDLRKVVEKDLRSYLRGVVLYNDGITDDDRRAMSIPVRDKVRTPVGDPQGQPKAGITYPGRAQLQLHVQHVEGTPSDARANYGCRIYYGVFDAGQPLPTAGKELRESRFTRHKKELFDFEQNDSGKTAVFCLRYENRKGKTGQWGPIVSAVIP
ncbi:MAG: hypothetical protein LBV41_08325 [Cytophagaceae bacterium]|nr:hypothetical protein [Cytophagaceae bacterium]